MNRSVLRAGDIVLVEHIPMGAPHAAKARPGLIVSGSHFNQGALDVIVAPITTKIRYGDPNQILLQTTDEGFVNTGLPRPSAIKCGSIFAYEKCKIRRHLGHVTSDILIQVRGVIQHILSGI